MSQNDTSHFDTSQNETSQNEKSQNDTSQNETGTVIAYCKNWASVQPFSNEIEFQYQYRSVIYETNLFFS